jgi:hypothetical protein
MPGPAPSKTTRRRNKPSIPTTVLPASGRSDPGPDVPIGYELATSGRAWWDWAWSTPQAAAWSDGDAYIAARRASLEDDLSTIERVSGLDLDEALAAESFRDFKFVVGRIASLATGRIALMKEIRELDDRLGLTPKSLTALRWNIVDDGSEPIQASKPARRYGHLAPVK